MGLSRGHFRGAGEESGFDHWGSDGEHAAVIGGAAPEEARAAIGLLLDDGGAKSDRRGAVRIGGAEDGHDGEANGGGDVHGAGIIAEKEMALGEERGEIGDGGFAGEIDGGFCEIGGDGGGDGNFGGSAEKDDVRVAMREESIERLGEAIGRPALGGAVRGASANGDTKGMGTSARFEKSFEGLPAGSAGNLQRDVGYVRELIEPTGAAKEFKVVEFFVGGNFTRLGNGDGLSEQKGAGIAGVTDASGDVGTPGEPSGVESILEEKSGVEFASAEFGNEPFAAGPAAMRPFGVVRDEFIADLLVAVDVGDVRAGEDADAGVCVQLPNGADGGEGQDRVADPVGGADEEVHAAALLAAMPERMAESKASCWGISRSMTARKTGSSPNRTPVRFCASFSVVRKALAPAARAAA